MVFTWLMFLGVSICTGFVWRIRDVFCCWMSYGLPLVAIPTSTFLFQVIETLQPETSEGSNSSSWANQNAWLGWLLWELEFTSTKMQNMLIR